MKKYIIAILITFMALPAVASAGGLKDAFKTDASSPLGNVGKKAGVDDVQDLDTATGRVINAALTLVGIIFLFLTVYGGFLWMTARGDEEQVRKAQKTIASSVIGLVIIVSAYAITFFVTSKLGS